MIKEAINTLVQGNDLSTGMMEQVMEEIMTNEATDAQKASFLTALSIKGETIDEITVAAKVMSSKCTYFKNTPQNNLFWGVAFCVKFKVGKKWHSLQ